MLNIISKIELVTWEIDTSPFCRFWPTVGSMSHFLQFFLTWGLPFSYFISYYLIISYLIFDAKALHWRAGWSGQRVNPSFKLEEDLTTLYVYDTEELSCFSFKSNNWTSYQSTDIVHRKITLPLKSLLGLQIIQLRQNLTESLSFFSICLPVLMVR